MQVAEQQRQSQSRDGGVQAPYRDAKLTYCLRDAFGGNTKTVVVANVAPTRACMHHTLATLEFAQRAALVKNFVQPNVVHTAGEVHALHAELERLRGQVSGNRVRRPPARAAPRQHTRRARFPCVVGTGPLESLSFHLACAP